MQDQQTPIKETELEIVQPTAIESIERATIDVQIATAHRYPRSMSTFKQRAVEMATLDEDTAASCIYSRPVGGGKFAEGLSIRTAEIVGACYGNLRVGAIIVEQTERFVKCRGFAHDLESNFASSAEVIEATIKRDGSPYDERMRIVIAKACLAKARRDATFQVVPKALCKPIENAARAVAIGDASTIEKRRDQVMEWVSKLGIDKSRVFAALQISGVDDIGLEQLATLTGLRTAIKDGEVAIDDAFPKGIAKGTVGATPIEQAANATPATKEEPQPETPPQAEPEQAEQKGPSAGTLRNMLLKKLTALGAGKMRLMAIAKELEIVPADAVWETLDAKQLATIDDAWEQVVDKIKNP